MKPLPSLIKINKHEKPPVYLQIASQLMQLISNHTLPSGTRLPSSRWLAESLGLHRKTIVRAYEELLAQGWLESSIGNGTFVSNHFPNIKAHVSPSPHEKNSQKIAGFSFETLPHLNRKVLKNSASLHLDDGFPDARLAPLEELSRAYRTQLLTGNAYVKLGYGDTTGSLWLRTELSTYLNETRGLKTTADNILVTRGTVMGLHLASNGLLKAGDLVAISEMSWASAQMNFLQAGAKIITLKADHLGIDVDALEKVCREKPIRMIYVTSHHHYPTTVALRADRRAQLMQLSEKYGFIIFEDDYDYDFHYLSKPLLPLAGADPSGMVLYCGSFTKAISPAFRVGYLVGSENVITHLAQLRRIIDRQGDNMLENAIAELLQDGVIQRHLRKSLRAYRARRDAFCQLMGTQLADHVSFQIPDGGMAVWTKFVNRIDIQKLSKAALQKGLYFSDGLIHHMPENYQNFTRLGFASSTVGELEESVTIIKNLIDNGSC